MHFAMRALRARGFPENAAKTWRSEKDAAPDGSVAPLPERVARNSFQSPSAQRVVTYGDSWSTAALRPLRIAIHSPMASTISTRIIAARTAVTAASRRLLKISRWVTEIFSAGIAPEEICAARTLACDRKPMRGLAEKIFW